MLDIERKKFFVLHQEKFNRLLYRKTKYGIILVKEYYDILNKLYEENSRSFLNNTKFQLLSVFME